MLEIVYVNITLIDQLHSLCTPLVNPHKSQTEKPNLCLSCLQLVLIYKRGTINLAMHAPISKNKQIINNLPTFPEQY